MAPCLYCEHTSWSEALLKNAPEAPAEVAFFNNAEDKTSAFSYVSPEEALTSCLRHWLTATAQNLTKLSKD